MAEGTEEERKAVNDNAYKKYGTFEELYKDYKNLIDTEFAQRHIHRMKQLRDCIENREKWMKAHIKQDSTRNNQYYYDKAELLEEVYDVVEKELGMTLPYDSFTDRKIKEVKNKIVDELFTGRLNEYRGREDYERNAKRAGWLADVIEFAIKDFINGRDTYNNDGLVSLISECRKQSIHKDRVLKTVHDAIEQRDFARILACIANGANN